MTLTPAGGRIKMAIANLLLFLNLYFGQGEQSRKKGKAECYIEGTCLFMLLLYIMTELLSVFHAVRFRTLFFLWFAFDLFLLIFFIVRNGNKGRIRLINVLKRRGRFGRYSYEYILGVIGAAALVLSVITVPYNWDSMTYHLPRIVYWVQNRSVEHYATNCIRQIASPVLGEFVNLHIYILCRGSDKLLNLLQCVSYLTCAGFVYAIAKKLKCDRLFCFIASLLYMTMPIAFAEALTTQVDNFATVWLLFFIYLLIDFSYMEEKINVTRSSVSKVCTMGMCAAWGYLAKPSVCIAMVCFLVWILFVCIARKDKVRGLLQLAACAFPCVVLPILPEMIRNFNTFHAYASSATGARQLVGTVNPLYLLVNFVKNFCWNLPTRLIQNSHIWIEKVPRKLAALLGVELDHQAISEDGRVFEMYAAPNYSHDSALNPLIMWLFILCVVLMIMQLRRVSRKSEGEGYSLTAAVSFCLFCVVLRWEPYVTRYMVSYFALLCPMAALSIQKWTRPYKRHSIGCGIVAVIGVLCITEFIGMVLWHYDIYRNGANWRSGGYFYNWKGESPLYHAMADDIAKYRYHTVGLYIGGEHFEYPIWELTKDSVEQIEHINVENESSIYAKEDFTPDCIVWIRSLPEKPVEINGELYDTVYDYGENHYLLAK